MVEIETKAICTDNIMSYNNNSGLTTVVDFLCTVLYAIYIINNHEFDFYYGTCTKSEL